VKAFVTGADGFVGRWLCAHLELCGDQVTKGIELDGFDVTQAEQVRNAVLEAQPEVIYHLAQQGLVGDSWKDPAGTFEVNANGTLNVLDAALTCDVPPRVILLSTSDVYGSVVDGRALDEDQPMAPVSPLAASKVAAEFLGLQAYLGTRLPVVRARTFSRIGPDQGDHFVAPALAQRIAQALSTAATSLSVGNLEARRDYVDVRDEVRAIRLLSEQGQPGEAYNICTGRDVTVRELAEKLLDEANAGMDLAVDPSLVRNREPTGGRGDNRKLTLATGWKPEIKLDQSLRDVLRYQRDRDRSSGR
jgi:GDP-4-dehydro-6-deoxy-D-mannose reductase